MFKDFSKNIKKGKKQYQFNTPLPCRTPSPLRPQSSTRTSRRSARSAAVSSEGKPTWSVPAGWKEIPGGGFLVAKFTISSDGGTPTAVNVSSSAGDGGGLVANVNRWRVQQLGLTAWSAEELSKQSKTVETAAGPATFVEFAGKDARSGQPTSLVGAMISQGGQTWFYKLMGDTKIVESQKEAFIRFVKEVKY